VSTPRSVVAWWRGPFLDKRKAQRQLGGVLLRLRNILTRGETGGSRSLLVAVFNLLTF